MPSREGYRLADAHVGHARDHRGGRAGLRCWTGARSVRHSPRTAPCPSRRTETTVDGAQLDAADDSAPSENAARLREAREARAVAARNERALAARNKRAAAAAARERRARLARARRRATPAATPRRRTQTAAPRRLRPPVAVVKPPRRVVVPPPPPPPRSARSRPHRSRSRSRRPRPSSTTRDDRLANDGRPPGRATAAVDQGIMKENDAFSGCWAG